MDRLRHAQIVQLEGRVAELECTKIGVKTEGTQYGVTHGTMRSFRFQVNGISVVLYTPESAIPNYSKVELPLSEGAVFCGRRPGAPSYRYKKRTHDARDQTGVASMPLSVCAFQVPAARIARAAC